MMMPMIARGGLSSEAFVPTWTVCSAPSRSILSVTVSPGFTPDITWLRSSGLGDVLAVRADDHVVGLEHAVRGGADIDGADHDAVGASPCSPSSRSATAAAILLRRAHLGEALLPLDSLREVLRVVDVGRDEGGAVVDPREVAARADSPSGR